MLLPINMAPIKLAGFCIKLERILAEKSPCFFSNSIFKRLAEIKAISIPEKKAEKKMAIKT